MDAPICEECLKSDSLCALCSNKLLNKKISRADVDVSRYLYELNKKHKGLDNVKIVKVIDSDSLIIISRRGDAAKIIGKGGVVAKTLAKNFNKPIRILEEAGSVKEFAEKLISPAHVQGMNTLYTDEGEVLKFRVQNTSKGMLYISPENFSNIMSSMYRTKAKLVFED